MDLSITLMLAVFIQAMICFACILAVVTWVGIQALIIKAFGLFGLMFVITLHMFAPVIIIIMNS